MQPFDSAHMKALAKHLGENGYMEQQAFLADGKVTKDEYWQAIQDLRGCVEGKGYGFSEPQLSPITGITYEFVYYHNGRSPEEAVADYDKCEARFWTPLSLAYLATHEQVMDVALKDAVLECMADAGEPGEPSGKNLAEISPVKDDDDGENPTRVKARECTRDAVQRLYPDMVSAAIYD